MSSYYREPPVVQQHAHCVMTDVECIGEALEKIGATVIGSLKQNADIQIKLNGKNWTLKRQIGRYSVTHMSNENVNWISQLRNQYNQAEARKREAIRQEKARLAKIKKDIEELNSKAIQAEELGKAAQFEQENALLRKEQEKELALREEEIKKLEIQQARIQAQKEEVVEERAAEFQKRGEEGNWNVQVQRMNQARKTVLRMTK